MRKVIFLDVDGVLNSTKWNEIHAEEVEKGLLVDMEKVRLLVYLTTRTKSEIVLHSGWKYLFDDKRKPIKPESVHLNDTFLRCGITISDMTPNLASEDIKEAKRFSLVKADEILLWLHDNPDVGAWVVLDDIPLKNDVILDHQIVCDPNQGLSDEDVKNAKSMLD